MAEHLDGNAIAGTLRDVFDAEMTTATATCASCGASRPVGELVVHQGPGVVGRCSACGTVLMVIVEVRGIRCVDLMGMADLRAAPGTA